MKEKNKQMCLYNIDMRVSEPLEWLASDERLERSLKATNK